MYYTGIDLHKKTSFITTIDDSGKVDSQVHLLCEGQQFHAHYLLGFYKDSIYAGFQD